MGVLEQLSNYVSGISLAASLTNGAGPIVATLNSVAGLPTVGNFDLRLDDVAPATTYEWVQVTSVNVGASQVTIGTRGLYGTSAIAHGIGAIVSNVLSVGALQRSFAMGVPPGGYAQIVANQAGITAQVDLTGLTVTVTLLAGRRIRLSLFTAGVFSSVVTDLLSLFLMEGASQLAQANVLGTGGGIGVTVSVVLTPTAGAHTYKAQASRVTGTGSMTVQAGATFPTYLLVEDIGQA